jgi:hypothetical protein
MHVPHRAPESWAASLRRPRPPPTGAFGDGLHDNHYIGVARQLGYTGSTLESEHTMPDYHLATLAELVDAV